MNLMLKVKRREFVECLVDAMSYALTYNLTESAEDLLGCLRQLRPRLEHLDYFEGWIAVLKGDYVNAMRVARGAVDRTGDWPYATVLLAYTKYASGDRTWAMTAERALSMPGADDARRLMLLLLGRIDAKEIGADENLLRAIAGIQSSAIESNFRLA